MIDTIRFEIKGLCEHAMQTAKAHLNTTMTINNQTGHIESEITRGSLRGSWDSRVSIQVRDYEWKVLEETTTYNVGHLEIISVDKKKAPVQVPCDEYLVVEFSLAKWANGVNFLNESLFLDAVYLTTFRRWLQDRLGLIKEGYFLPYLEQWRVVRVDLALNFELGTHAAAKEYINSWRNLDYPRRKKPVFYEESIFVSGSTTALKLYYKYAEFKKHDEPRIASFIYNHGYDSKKGKAYAAMIRELTKGLMRFEVEFRKRKLEMLEINNVIDVINTDWVKHMKTEIYRIIDGAETTKTYRYQEVINILQQADITGSGISRDACGVVWSTIVMKGKKYAQKKFGTKKVQRARKVFKELGINTLGHLSDKKVPVQTKSVNIFDFERSNGKLKKLQYYDLLDEQQAIVNY